MKQFLWLFGLLVACTSGTKQMESPEGAITIMAYNVENLFDTQDDPGKKDETYLPLSQKQSDQHKKSCQNISNPHYRRSCLTKDWNAKKLSLKMKRLSEVILATKNGKGPDILILEEVENISVLETFRKDYLSAAGYQKAILVEGPDKRGIDVGMLSRVPLAGRPKLHLLNLKVKNGLKSKNIRPTRGILHSQFQLDKTTKLHVFGVHFPSQANPTETRRQAVELLNTLGRQVPTTDIAVVGGDFNITTKEDNKRKLYKSDVASQWMVSHQMGCKDCKGTHNYRGKWSFLDALLFSKNMGKDGASNWQIRPQTIRVETLSKLQVQPKNGFPARFEDGRKDLGVSDHWPIVAEIEPRKKPSSSKE